MFLEVFGVGVGAMCKRCFKTGRINADMCIFMAWGSERCVKDVLKQAESTKICVYLWCGGRSDLENKNEMDRNERSQHRNHVALNLRFWVSKCEPKDSKMEPWGAQRTNSTPF